MRLIHRNYFSADLPLPVHIEAFRPTNADVDGLSVFHANEATPEQALAVVAPEKRQAYFVATIKVIELNNIGLTIRSSPIDEAPGHYVIPEINAIDYNRDKASKVAMKSASTQAGSTGIQEHRSLTYYING